MPKAVYPKKETRGRPKKVKKLYVISSSVFNNLEDAKNQILNWVVLKELKVNTQIFAIDEETEITYPDFNISFKTKKIRDIIKKSQ